MSYVEDGEWEYVEEDKPQSGFIGIPHNNPLRDPDWENAAWRWDRACRDSRFTLPEDTENVRYSWISDEDADEVEQFFSEQYVKVITLLVLVAFAMAVVLIQVAT